MHAAICCVSFGITIGGRANDDRSLSKREELLLNAALNRDPALAVTSWQAWTAQIALEDAPRPAAAPAHRRPRQSYQIAPQLGLPPKLRRKGQGQLCQNPHYLFAQAALPLIEELGRHSPVMLTKGMAICIRFGAWSSRSLFDVDFHVPTEGLGQGLSGARRRRLDARFRHHAVVACAPEPHASGQLELLVKGGAGKIYNHWRLLDTPSEAWLPQQMWSTGDRVKFSGRTLMLQSPEFALLSSLHHGFVTGTRPDALQTVVDAAALLPLCGNGRLLLLLRKAELLEALNDLLSIFKGVGLPGLLLGWGQAPARKSHRLAGLEPG